MEGMSEDLSVLDVCGGINLPDPMLISSRYAPLGSLLQQTHLDSTQPQMPERARSDYIEGLALLQTDERIDYSEFDTQLNVTVSKLMSKRYGMGKHLLDTSKEQILSRTCHGSPLLEATTPLSRHQFSLAFDPISEVAAHTQTFALAYSAFDGPLSTISTDIAPYVRSIVQFDLALEEQRLRLSHLLGGNTVTGKRSRTTRAARSALEGGKRESTRRERWFPAELDFNAVLATGGQSWPNTGAQVIRNLDDTSQGNPSVGGSQVDLSQGTSVDEGDFSRGSQ